MRYLKIILIAILLATPATPDSYLYFARCAGQLASTPDNQDGLTYLAALRVERLDPWWESARFWVEVETYIEGEGFQKTGSGFTPSSVKYSLGVSIPLDWISIELGQSCWHRMDAGVGPDDHNQQGAWVGFKVKLPIE